MVNPWVVTFSVMLATFMEVLDTTVVNVSIPHIAGNLANEEGSRVVTSYPVSNAVVLPISGWLANYMGRKRRLLTCVAGFTLTPLLCGFATSLPQLIIFRILQGLTGAGLQPLAQAILLETFPKERHGHAMAAFGIGILLAPILEPTLGGWITDNYSWRWIFYLNLSVGILSLVLMSRFVVDPHYVKRGTGRVDLWGIGSLQVLLDTGQRKDWFSSSYIRIFTVLCVIGLVALVIREFEDHHPVVDLRGLGNRSFSAGVFLIGMLGFILYASLVLLPCICKRSWDTRPTTHSITMFDLSGLNPHAGFLGHSLGSGPAGCRPQFCLHSIDDAGHGTHPGRENGQLDQHLQSDAQYRRQRGHRHHDHVPGPPSSTRTIWWPVFVLAIRKR